MWILQVSHVPTIDYPPESWHENGKSPFSIGDTSSNGWFSSVMLVFWGADSQSHSCSTWDLERSWAPDLIWSWTLLIFSKKKTGYINIHGEVLFVRCAALNTCFHKFWLHFDSRPAETQEELGTVPRTKKQGSRILYYIMFSIYITVPDESSLPTPNRTGKYPKNNTKTWRKMHLCKWWF